LFKNWLPSDYQIVTKGRLVSEKGKASPQVDVIVLYPFYPKHLLDKKLYLTAGVAAAFECKNTLMGSHIVKAVQNSVSIKDLTIYNKGTYKKELYSPIIYGLVCHSHSWKSDDSLTTKIITEKLVQSDQEYCTNPRQCLDFVCVSDLAVWSSLKQPLSLKLYEQYGTQVLKWDEGIQSAYALSDKYKFGDGTESRNNFTPIGTFLSKLLKRFALSDERLKHFSDYFASVLPKGAALKWRNWPNIHLSEEAKKDLILNESKYLKEGFLNV
jgi:hypothetical protein